MVEDLLGHMTTFRRILQLTTLAIVFMVARVHDEVDDTFNPILTVIAGYGRFVLIVVATAYLLMGHGWAAAAHFVVAAVMFALFYRHHRAREMAIHDQLQLEQDEGDDDVVA